MRFDKEVIFIKKGEKVYDRNTGDYNTGEPVRTPVLASVNDTGINTLNIVYGNVKQDSITVTLQNHYEDAFDLIEFEGRPYRVDRRIRLRVKDSFVCSEVQHE